MESDSISVGKLIQALKDIKSVKDAFPSVDIAMKSIYTKIRVRKKLKYGNFAEMELIQGSNNWILVSHSLPDKAVASLLKIDSSLNLKTAVENFMLIVNNLSNYFEALYILDLNCIILEPLIKTTKINWRLIKYSKFAFLKIDFVDPLDVNNFNVSFLGKDHIIKELNETYNKLSEADGDEEMDIYQKLCTRLKILEFPYSNKPDTDECAICLCPRNDENEYPIICCENPKCDQLFHASCLSQHLNINSKSIRILNVSVGECPFCKTKISSNYAGFIRNQTRTDDSDELSQKHENMDID